MYHFRKTNGGQTADLITAAYRGLDLGLWNVWEKTGWWCLGLVLLMKGIIIHHHQVENKIPPREPSSLKESEGERAN